jgi:hypothetical protein
MVYDPFHPPSFWVRYLIFWLLNLSHCFFVDFPPTSLRDPPKFPKPGCDRTLPRERLSTHVFSTPPPFFLLSVSKILPRLGGFTAVDVYSFPLAITRRFLMHLDYGDRPWVSRGLRNIHFPFLFLCALWGSPRFFVRHSMRKVVLVLKRDLVYSFILAIPTGIETIWI